MTHAWMTQIAQVTGMFFFIGLFVAVLAYALWPSNRERFKRAALSPLHDDTPED